MGVAVDRSGNLCIADPDNHAVVNVGANGVLTRVAGNGLSGNSGDGGIATAVPLSSPSDVAVDVSGNLYVLDTGTQRLHKISSAGAIRTVAGGGNLSPTDAEGKLATDAQLSTAADNGMALDAVGNIYISEYFTNRIRKATPAGIISTAAGNGSQGFSGDGAPASQASLGAPTGVAVDAAGLYISDNLNGRVRRVTIDGGINTSASHLRQPSRLALDTAGNLYITDYFSQIFKLVPGGTPVAVAGSGTVAFSGDGGSAIKATMTWPRGIAVDQGSGSIYFADSGNKRVRMVAGSVISTVAGNGRYRFDTDGTPATGAWLDVPDSVIVDSAGIATVADSYAERIRKITPGGSFFTIAGNDLGLRVPLRPFRLASTTLPIWRSPLPETCSSRVFSGSLE
jgi:sugar lactone lactonase YvrE